jgi:hypothetical protein
MSELSLRAKPKINYANNFDLLKEIEIKDSAKLIDEDNYKENLKRETQIKFNCSCGECGKKAFRMIMENSGMFCKKCTTKVKTEKTKKTNLEVYGTENVSQNKDIKEKKKETTKKNYGVENPLKNKDVVKKMLTTRLKNNLKIESDEELPELPDKVEIIKKLVQEYEAVLIDEEKYINNLEEKTIVYYKCKCGEETSKQFRSLECDMYCKKCSIKKRSDKMVNTLKNQKKISKYANNIELLKELETRDSATIFNYEIYEQELVRETKIIFLCGCGEEGEKEFRKINEESGMFCRDCTYKNKTEKTKDTLREKYGVENISQLEDIMSKKLISSFSTKEYILPSGNTTYLQGYEPFALNILLKSFEEDDIICFDREKMPNIIWYDNENKKHIHFVDFYIKSINKCIEIKSTFTFGKDEEKIFLKQKYAKQLGYNYEIWIISQKGNILEIFN